MEISVSWRQIIKGNVSQEEPQDLQETSHIINIPLYHAI